MCLLGPYRRFSLHRDLKQDFGGTQQRGNSENWEVATTIGQTGPMCQEMTKISLVTQNSSSCSFSTLISVERDERNESFKISEDRRISSTITRAIVAHSAETNLQLEAAWMQKCYPKDESVESWCYQSNTVTLRI